ncbi:MAG: glycosyltransferase [Bacteroidales bacterium]|nr:glycosyltransferase [Bacteroidales bacterium]
MSSPLVSACLITYNHEYFINKCIEGALIQELSFPYEIIIGEDFSIDGTRDICLEYAEKHPQIIRLVCNDKNLGMVRNWTLALQECKGKYIAICEGDDYWTDPLKLQNQVDFLEAHPEYMISFHAVDLMIHNNGTSSLSNNTVQLHQNQFTIEDLLKCNFINTPSLVIRNTDFLKRITNSYEHIPTLDWMITILASQYGKICYFPESMAVYRMHDGGIHSHKDKKYFLESAITLFEFLEQNINPEFHTAVFLKYKELLGTRVLYAMKDLSKPDITAWFRRYKKVTSEWSLFIALRLIALAIFKFVLLLRQKVSRRGLKET